MEIKNLRDAPPFITKDGSEIRELLAHRNSAIRQQSLAEARLPVGASTQVFDFHNSAIMVKKSPGAGKGKTMARSSTSIIACMAVLSNTPDRRERKSVFCAADSMGDEEARRASI